MTGSRSRQPDTVRSIVYALSANLAIAVCKARGAVFTGSGALLAETFHSLADTGNECLLLLGRRQAKAPASTHHPLGHGRATYFWSFVVALLLFVLGGVLSIYEGIHKLREPAPLVDPWVAVAIVAFAMLAEGISLRMALKQIDKVRRDLTLWRWFRETRRSELIIVLGEDIAALSPAPRGSSLSRPSPAAKSDRCARRGRVHGRDERHRSRCRNRLRVAR